MSGFLPVLLSGKLMTWRSRSIQLNTETYRDRHGLVWGVLADSQRFKDLIPRRGEKLRAGPCDNPPIIARRVRRTEADLAGGLV